MDIPLYFYAAFKDMDRLAPGSDKSTLKAIGYIDFNKDSQLTILDIGCGVGASTLLLVDYFKNSTIEAIEEASKSFPKSEISIEIQIPIEYKLI